LIDLAIRGSDGAKCARLAHYSKGACSNLGASAAATVLADIEKQANRGAFDECGQQLRMLASEVDRLRSVEI
jgi:HPt (histidine-containing phosphotransfer) domain-containing protein